MLAVCTSQKKGTRKQNVGQAEFITGHGIKHDAHAGAGHRQVSLLAWESVEKIRAKGLNVNAGSFAENITTQGIDLLSLAAGQRLKIGQDVILEVTQIGKQCHKPCAIYRQTGDCVMPKEGIFAKIIHGGIVKADDRIVKLND
ncbi:MAG: MOSC domain-containing protein [Elusimicrobia bacterium]|nr:MOSC domain-containing protein [Elusimicrobiota bacterium]